MEIKTNSKGIPQYCKEPTLLDDLKGPMIESVGKALLKGLEYLLTKK